MSSDEKAVHKPHHAMSETDHLHVQFRDTEESLKSGSEIVIKSPMPNHFDVHLGTHTSEIYMLFSVTVTSRNCVGFNMACFVCRFSTD